MSRWCLKSLAAFAEGSYSRTYHTDEAKAIWWSACKANAYFGPIWLPMLGEEVSRWPGQ